MVIDEEILYKLDITPSQYALAYAIYRRDRKLYEYIRVKLSSKAFTANLEALVSARLIHDGSPEGEQVFEDMSIRHGFIESLEIPEDQAWNEFVLTYPRKEGTRPLHNNREDCKKKYMKLVSNNPVLHRDILRAVENEVVDRKMASYRREFRPAWKLMSTYINQRGWEMYLDKDNNKEESEDTNGSRITRTL